MQMCPLIRINGPNGSWTLRYIVKYMCLANEERIISFHMDNLELDRLHFETNFKMWSFYNTFIVILIEHLKDKSTRLCQNIRYLSKATYFITWNSVLLDVSQDLLKPWNFLSLQWNSLRYSTPEDFLVCILSTDMTFKCIVLQIKMD